MLKAMREYRGGSDLQNLFMANLRTNRDVPVCLSPAVVD